MHAEELDDGKTLRRAQLAYVRRDPVMLPVSTAAAVIKAMHLYHACVRVRACRCAWPFCRRYRMP